MSIIDLLSARVIGQTISGKNVWNIWGHRSLPTYTKQDHLDAAEIHKNYHSPFYTSREIEHHKTMVEKHLEAAK